MNVSRRAEGRLQVVFLQDFARISTLTCIYKLLFHIVFQCDSQIADN